MKMKLVPMENGKVKATTIETGKTLELVILPDHVSGYDLLATALDAERAIGIPEKHLIWLYDPKSEFEIEIDSSEIPRFTRKNELFEIVG